MGHTMSIHSRNDAVILEFGLRKPAFRIVVNTPTTHGSIGLTTGLDPAMTLGCGGYGGNITSDNISPRHRLNIKRLAYEVRPAVVRPARQETNAAAPLPRPPAAPPPSVGIAADVLTRRIDEFLTARGFAGGRPAQKAPDAPDEAPISHVKTGEAHAPDTPSPADFVCEEDVRQAVRQGRKIVIGERSIVTPAARDLGEQHHLFVQAAWPR
jgi:acetaldehyde dehydrogenase (acetylating)